MNMRWTLKDNSWGHQPIMFSIAEDISSAFSWTPKLPFLEQMDDIVIRFGHSNGFGSQIA